MIRYALVLAILLTLLPAGVWSARAAAAAPNIVFILADDMGWNDVGYHGSEIRTPNIDRLAAEGVKLESHYVLPVCTPTRAALLTGRYPIRYGLQYGVIRGPAVYGLPLEERLLPQALKGAGYRTAMVGKWHLGHHDPAFLPENRGWDHFYGHYTGAISYTTRMFCGGLDWHRNGSAVFENGYSTTLLGSEAVRVIQDHDTTRPLLLYLPFNAPHTPLEAPQQYLEQYSHITDTKRRTFAAMVTCMDDAIGRVVQALEARGMTRNTLVVFASDNGGAVDWGSRNTPFFGEKATLWEGGVRVPALARWPGTIAAGKTVTEPVHVVDWYPTLLRLAGASLEQERPLDGLDLWPTLTADAPSPHEDLLLNIAPRWAGIRRGPWKFVRVEPGPGEDGGGETTRDGDYLFHLGADPKEANNLVATQPAVAADLKARLDAYAAQAARRLNREDYSFQVPPVWGEPPPGPTLSPPSDVEAAVNPGQNSVTLSWTDNSLVEIGFNIERVSDAGEVRQFNSGPDTTTWINTGCQPGVTYTYRLRAYHCYGYGAYSPPASVRVTDEPAAPTGLQVAPIAPDKVRLSWDAPPRGVTGTIIERSRGSDPFTEARRVTAGVSELEIAGLVPAAAYRFRLRAYNGVGISVPSDPVEARTWALPSPPLGVAAETLSPTSVRVSWRDDGLPKSGFRVERQLNLSWLPVGTTGPEATTLDDATVKEGGAYVYRVRALGGNFASDPSREVTATTPPVAPRGVVVTGLTGSARVTWGAPPGLVLGYTLERQSEDGTFAEIARPGADAGAYVDRGLEANTPYTYRVRARNGGGESPPSQAAAAMTLPAVPTDLTATVPPAPAGRRMIELTWTDASPRPSGFVVERSTDGGSRFSLLAAVPEGATGFNDRALEAGKVYVYRVAAENASGRSSFTPNAGARTLPPAGASELEVTTPPPPEGRTRLSLLWKAVSGTSRYLLDRSTDGGSTFRRIASLGAGTLAYEDRGLEPDKEYAYRLEAVDADGGVLLTLAGGGRTLPEPPARPTGLAVTAPPEPEGRAELEVRWDPQTGVIGFRLERSENGGATFSDRAALGPGAVTFRDRGLEPDTTYTYRLLAVNAGGESAPSPAASARTRAAPGEAPTGLTVRTPPPPEGRTQLELVWNRVTGALGYRVERRGAGDEFRQVARTNGTATFTDRGLTLDTEYTYRVRAELEGGITGASTPASGTTLPLPPPTPEEFKGALTGPADVTLRWNLQRGASEYVLERRAESESQFVEIARVPGNSGEYTDRGLRPATRYAYRLRGSGRGGESSPAGPVSVTTAGGPIDLASFMIQPRRARGGKKVIGTVTLSAPAWEPVRVTLTAPPRRVAAPAEVVVPAGSRSAQFTLRTLRTRRARRVTLGASLGKTVKQVQLRVLRSR